MTYEIRELATGDYGVFRGEELILVRETKIKADVWAVNHSREYEKTHYAR